MLKDVLGYFQLGLKKALLVIYQLSLCVFKRIEFDAVVPSRRSLLALDKLKRGRYELNELSENKLCKLKISEESKKLSVAMLLYRSHNLSPCDCSGFGDANGGRNNAVRTGVVFFFYYYYLFFLFLIVSRFTLACAFISLQTNTTLKALKKSVFSESQKQHANSGNKNRVLKIFCNLNFQLKNPN